MNGALMGLERSSGLLSSPAKAGGGGGELAPIRKG